MSELNKIRAYVLEGLTNSSGKDAYCHGDSVLASGKRQAYTDVLRKLDEMIKEAKS